LVERWTVEGFGFGQIHSYPSVTGSTPVREISFFVCFFSYFCSSINCKNEKRIKTTIEEMKLQ
jgi:hypothetical protein